MIGRRVDGVNYFDGSIDELRVFNSARTAIEIQADMNGEICNSPANLVAYYKLNEGLPNGLNTSNSIAVDYSGNGNDGVLNGFALTGTSSNWSNGPTLNPRTTYSSFTANNCNSYNSPSGNYNWSTSGIYMDTIANSFGCDSIMTIDLTIGNATSEIYSSDCISYTAPSGAVYATSGVYLDTLLLGSTSGCDSIITLNLTIGVSVSSLVAEECSSYLSPFGELITSSGIYSDTIPNGSTTGCDSIVNMDVTINFPTTSSAVFHTCQDSFQVSGVWYSTDQTFVSNHTNSVNCDSTHTLNLVFSADVTNTINIEACDSYTSTQGQTFTSSNTFFESFPAANTCDSIVEFILIIHESASTTSSITACDSIEIDGVWYFDDEMITYTDTTIHGCDSVHTLDLTVVKIDNSISIDSDWSLKAVDIAGATYAWYYCNANDPIAGETNSLFEFYEIGDYKVEISLNGCSKFSECEYIIGESISEMYNSKDLEIAPNPNNGLFKLSLLDQEKIQFYQIIDIIGEMVINETIDDKNSIIVDLELKSGIYFVKVNTKDQIYMKQIVVE